MTHKHINQQANMASSTPPTSQNASLWVAEQLAQHAMHLAPADLEQTAVHYQLLCEHAANVMGFPLPEAIEPAPEFRPLTFCND